MDDVECYKLSILYRERKTAAQTGVPADNICINTVTFTESSLFAELNSLQPQTLLYAMTLPIICRTYGNALDLQLHGHVQCTCNI